MTPISVARRSLLAGAGLMLLPSLPARAEGARPAEGPISLPPLPYPAEALSPTIDAETMRLHHGRHHKAYIDKLNEALKEYPDLAGKKTADLLQMLDQIPEAVRSTIRNNGGGHVNHSMFWTLMRPGGSAMPAAVEQALTQAFGSVEEFKSRFEKAGLDQFGSGWVFLVQNQSSNQLEIETRPNQDTPWMTKDRQPVLGNDLWEHAYYLTYRNARARYLKAWWDVVDWEVAAQRLDAGRRGEIGY